MKIIDILILFTGIILGISLCITMIIPIQFHTEKGDCYDYSHNKIYNLTCDIKINDGVQSNYQWVVYLALISLFLLTGFVVIRTILEEKEG